MLLRVRAEPGCKPYFENGRIFCTFSARAGHKYTKSVASIDPATFNFRMEGILLTNYGDGDPLLRNDAVNHLFRDADGTWKAVGCGWSMANNSLGARKGNGLVVMECTKNPLHGITVMKARMLKVGKGISEDLMVTMDRQNFPGMPTPNWTYGGMYFYGANPE